MLECMWAVNAVWTWAQVGLGSLERKEVNIMWIALVGFVLGSSLCLKII